MPRFAFLSLVVVACLSPALSAGEDKIKESLRTGKGIVLLAGDVGLPAVPTAWGLAIAGGGNNIVVTLMDGRVMAFAK